MERTGVDVAFTALAGELTTLFAAGVDAPLSAGRFDEIALASFRFQFEGNATFRGFCLGRGITPDSVSRWEDVPAVPATAFKYVDLGCVPSADAEAVFVTSGTTRGAEARGRHPVPSLALYRAAALPPLTAHLNPGGERLPLLSLIPSPRSAPHSSLSAMMGFAAQAWADPVHWLAEEDGTPRVEAFVAAARQLVAEGRPVLVAGTAFAFVHLLDGMEAAEGPVVLPEGSRLMETGGFKGRSRVVRRDELYAALEARLGVPTHRMVNEYGMTELLSQLWEPVLARGAAARGLHVPPPWLRIRALDPATLEPLPPGRAGVLAFYDLANLGSVSHVLTQDVGVVDGEGVRLQGRAEGAEPRGCSLALEELLARSGDAP